MNQSTGTSILLVDDDQTFSRVLQRALSRRGFQVSVANSFQQAIKLAEEAALDRAIVDLNLGNDTGLQLIPELKQQHPAMQILVLTGYSSVATAVEAIKLGAMNYLCKPASAEELLAAFDIAPADPELEIPEKPPSVRRLEWEHIQRVLIENDNNISATARALGMHRRTLQRKLRKRPASEQCSHDGVDDKYPQRER